MVFSDHYSQVIRRTPHIKYKMWIILKILLIVFLQIFLNERVTAGPNWLLPTLEVALLIPLTVVRTTLVRRSGDSQAHGWLPSHGPARVLAFGLPRSGIGWPRVVGCCCGTPHAPG